MSVSLFATSVRLQTPSSPQQQHYIMNYYIINYWYHANSQSTDIQEKSLLSITDKTVTAVAVLPYSMSPFPPYYWEKATSYCSNSAFSPIFPTVAVITVVTAVISQYSLPCHSKNPSHLHCSQATSPTLATHTNLSRTLSHYSSRTQSWPLMN